MELVPTNKRGFVLAVSAPSGTGKTSLCDKLARDFTYVVRSISVTTRPMRTGEVSGSDYIFVSPEEFKERETRNELIETAQVFGNWYGTPKQPVMDAIDRGQVIVMDIDTEGALRIHKLMPKDCVLVFVLPPSFEELEKRLRARGKNAGDELERRLKEAAREVRESAAYHYYVANVSFDVAYENLRCIVEAERSRVHRQSLDFIAKGSP